ncbi:DUF1554 domain-containing protein [Leptospira perdikensis]|uniref:DUF1554 domain-containing protein n=1 Tax=Leptospira perdikensis TaxID=2484948 RepID=A0A4V3JPI3_9LEPT|nr:DUF1554 domain-containing protein [Leptospira perdikensis]TGL44359.1 DUF1554 domain-containing protein [Leptospira perdikensis]
MRFGFLFVLVTLIQCSKPELNNPSDFGTDSYLENQTILCLTGQTSACRLAVPVCTNCRFFSTSTTYNGARGGIIGADAICMSDSKKPTEPARAVYKAFLVDDVNRIACTTSNCSGGVSEHTDWILKPDTSYFRAADLTKFAVTDSFGIFNSQLVHVDVNVLTNTLTGLATGGWTTRTNNHCNRWTDGTGTGNAGVAANSLSVFTSTLGSCNAASVILCVEQ